MSLFLWTFFIQTMFSINLPAFEYFITINNFSDKDKHMESIALICNNDITNSKRNENKTAELSINIY